MWPAISAERIARTTPGPDFDFGGAITLTTNADGDDVIVAGQKSGQVFALDPDRQGAGDLAAPPKHGDVKWWYSLGSRDVGRARLGHDRRSATATGRVRTPARNSCTEPRRWCRNLVIARCARL